MKKKIIEGWGALRCRLGTRVERLQRVRQVCFQRKQLKVTLFGSFWMSIVFFACFLIYPPTVGITMNNRFFYYSLHPSTFRPSLLKFLCDTSAVVCLPLMIVACLLCIDWIMHTIGPLFMLLIFDSHHVSLRYFHSLINQRVVYWHISLYTTTSLYHIRSVYLYICIIYIYIIYITCINIYILGICVFYALIGTTFQDDEEELNRQRATAFMVLRPSMSWEELSVSMVV